MDFNFLWTDFGIWGKERSIIQLKKIFNVDSIMQTFWKNFQIQNLMKNDSDFLSIIDCKLVLIRHIGNTNN